VGRVVSADLRDSEGRTRFVCGFP